VSTNRKPDQPAPAGDVEIRTFAFELEEIRDAEGGRSDDYTIRGHAAVFNTWTDLGFFKERVAKGAFDDVLAADPHTLHTWDHDTAKTLSSTRATPPTLELRVDPRGLHFWSRVAPTSYAADLRILMERGDVNQASFAFTVADDEWVIRGDGDDEVIERTIVKVAELFDVTTTAMGAYPTTDSQLAARTLERARAIADQGLPAPPPDTGAGQKEEPPPDTGAGSKDEPTAPASPAARARAELLVLKRDAKNRVDRAREAQSQIDREVRR
jgi:HK97 family phage prohead protease